MPCDDRSIYETPRRLLLMVAEIHRRGYERLRIFFCEDQWGAWRCLFLPALIELPDGLSEKPQHVCVYMRELFGWKDAAGDSVEELADKFIERFPKTSNLCQGKDEGYVKWFAQMLTATEPDGLIIELADRPLPNGYLITCNLPRNMRIPLPPPVAR
jgi:hypothetical protein